MPISDGEGSAARGMTWPLRMVADQQQLEARLAVMVDLPEADLPAAWQTLQAHVRAQFAREDDWMAVTAMPLSSCHTGQHAVVLRVLAEDGAQAKPARLRQLLADLQVWFNHHAKTMDAALAQHLQQLGWEGADPRGTAPLATADAAKA